MDQKRLHHVFSRVARAAGHQVPLVIVQGVTLNAWTDGQRVFVTDTLVNRLSEREVAAVLGHELGHVVERHIATSVEERQLLRQKLETSFPNDPLAAAIARTVAEVALAIASGTRNRALEHRADKHGERLSQAAGYAPGAMRDVLSTLGMAPKSYTHPATEVRQKALAPGKKTLRIRIKRSRS